MKQTQIYGFNKSYKMLTQTSNNEKKWKKKKKKDSEANREALRYCDTAARLAELGAVKLCVRTEEVRSVRASSRSTGMEMLCFTEMKR